jgi:hypothetical protein
MLKRATKLLSGSKKKEETRAKEDIMKTVITALVALAVLAGVAASVSADPYAKKFFEKIDRQKN